MFTVIITTLTKLAANLGVKAASALIPYAVALTPAVVFIGGCVALYLRFKSDAIDLILMASVLVNGAVVAAQIGSLGSSSSTPSKPSAPSKP